VAVSLQGLKMTEASTKAVQKAKDLGLTITSAYRSPAEDKRVGGTGTGYHTLGQALDVAGSKANMDKFAQWAKSSGLFRSVLWQVPDHYDHVHVSWNVSTSSSTPSAPSGGIVQEGNKGGLVGAIQKLLGGIKVDNVFGPQTEQAVKQFQENRNLEADGIVGSKTWNELTSGGGSFFS
jgi:peptidoglycan hydrolase-like protein with peptidoglycan-binding domain